MQLVERHIIGQSDSRWSAIDQACWFAKNVYNAATYKVRQAYFATGCWPRYEDLDKQFKQKDLLPDQQLPMKVVQHVLRQVDHDWQSYFAAWQCWRANPAAFTGQPRLPGYKNKARGRNQLVYTEQAISKTALARDGLVVPSGLGITVKTDQRQIDQVRICPKAGHYVVEIVYTQAELVSVPTPWAVAIDLNVNNLAVLTSNQPGFVPLLVNGRPLKAINQRYNKRLADLRARLPQGQFTSKRIRALTDKRNRRLDYHLHLASRRIIEVLEQHHIGTLIIGKNDGWKQEVALGDRNNQNFVQLPHARFVELLTYKAQLVGIRVVLIEESYTSKCSFLDIEPLQQHAHYLGRRIHRGLFRASDRRHINADVNGSYNILRKVIPDAFRNGIAGAVVHPVRLKLTKQTHL
jgi:putative transposase